jgi:hypothetical protein
MKITGIKHWIWFQGILLLKTSSPNLYSNALKQPGTLEYIIDAIESRSENVFLAKIACLLQSFCCFGSGISTQLVRSKVG